MIENSIKFQPRLAIFRSNPISPNPRVEKAASAASKLASVTVVGWDRTGNLLTHQTRPDFSLELFSLKAPFGSGIRNLTRLLRWQFFLVKWIFKNGRKYSVYHACDFDTVFPALFGKVFFKGKVIYDICDFYADHVRNTPAWILNLVRFADRLAIRFADAVILVDDVRKKQLGNINPKRLEIIYNTPQDLELSDSIDKNQGGFRIAYIGTLQLERGLLELFEVLGKNPNWHLDLAGFGGDEEVIKSQALQIPGIIWHGRVDYTKALQLSQISDVLIATYDPSVPNHQYSSPNKVFEAMMLSKPIIVARGTHVDQLIEKWQCGLVVPYGDVKSLETTLRILAENVELRTKLGLNARKAYDEQFSWKIMEMRMNRLYTNLLSPEKPNNFK